MFQLIIYKINSNDKEYLDLIQVSGSSKFFVKCIFGLTFNIPDVKLVKMVSS